MDTSPSGAAAHPALARQAPPPALRAEVGRRGFALVFDVVARPAINELNDVMAQGQVARLERNGSAFGARNLSACPAIAALAASPPVRALVEPIAGPDAIVIRGLFFDKTAEANWPVLWHQDLCVAVARRHDVLGWGPWSTKAGVVHVRPPTNILEAMVSVRLHLDDCGPDNGPLRVLAGTHRLGILDRDRIARLRSQIRETVCAAAAGAALIMRPLLLHGSGPARRPRHRRVIHLEFAPTGLLPPPFDWPPPASKRQTNESESS